MSFDGWNKRMGMECSHIPDAFRGLLGKLLPSMAL